MPVAADADAATGAGIAVGHDALDAAQSVALPAHRQPLLAHNQKALVLATAAAEAVGVPHVDPEPAACLIGPSSAALDLLVPNLVDAKCVNHSGVGLRCMVTPLGSAEARQATGTSASVHEAHSCPSC